MKKFVVTKCFVTGHLQGMTIEEYTDVPFKVGQKYEGVMGTGSYVVRSIRPTKEEYQTN